MGLFKKILLALAVSFITGAVGATAFHETFAQNDSRVERRAATYRALQASVMIGIRVPASPPKVIFGCGATVVTADSVLTAAHCVRGLVLTRLSVISYDGSITDINEAIKTATELDLVWLRTVGPVKGAVPAQVSTNISVRDRIFTIGAPLGEAFMVSEGIISKINGNERFENCEDNDKLGTDPQQVVWFDGMTFFGNSGGGVFDEYGNLIGVLVRVVTWQANCEQQGTSTLWGLAVGPNTIKEFLEGR